jgi:hypothetical protein
VLRTGEILLDMTPHRERLLAIKHGEVPWPEVTEWAGDLQRDLADAEATTRLPDRPDTAKIDQLLSRVRGDGVP